MIKNAFVTILALAVGVSVSTSALAAKKKKKMPPKDTAPLLQPFVEGKGRLPEHYAGVDEKRFFEIFKKQLGALEKRKDESLAQFVERAADTETVLKPIGTKVNYAFRVVGLSASYNAARQVYHFGGKNGYGCPASGFREGYVTCPISDHVLPAERAVSANAEPDVEMATTHEIHGIAIPIDSLFVQDGFQLDRNKFYFNQELPVTEEKVQELRGATVSVLFVGKVAEDRFVNDRGEKLLPVVKTTRHTTTVEYDVPFQVSRIVYYVQQTGEILQQVVY